MQFSLNLFARGLAAAAAFAFAAAGGAQAELGPAVGASIPSDLSATDSTGVARTFETLKGENGLALYFVRSVDWCPYCKAQTLEVDAARDEFAKRGLGLAFVSYDSVKQQSDFAKAKNVSVTMLSDPKSEIIDAFGLRNEMHKEGRFAGIPHPAAFIISPDGVIRAKLYEEDYLTNDKSYRQRPAVASVLEAADAAMKDAAQ